MTEGKSGWKERGGGTRRKEGREGVKKRNTADLSPQDSSRVTNVT